MISASSSRCTEWTRNITTRLSASETAHGAEKAERGNRPRQVMHRRHRSDEAALIDLRLGLDGLAQTMTGAAGREFPEGNAEQVGEDERPALTDDGDQLALQAPRIFLENARALTRRQQRQCK